MESKIGPPMTLNQRNAAFTRTDALILAGVIGLLMAVVFPAPAHDRARSLRIMCANNLRQVGSSFQLWGNDHGEQPPFYVYPESGGTRNHVLTPNVWYHFAWISNELVSPRILLCPSDSGTPAEDFSLSHRSGYLHPNFKGMATSYLLAHQGGMRFDADQYLSGDRNVGGYGSGESSIFRWSLRMSPTPSNPLQWLPGLHSSAGNLLRNDGGVEQLGDREIQSRFDKMNVSFLLEFITPR